MIHPLFKLFLSHSDVLAEHVCAYGKLFCAEANDISVHLRKRAALTVLAALGFIFSIGFTGFSLLLWAVVPVASMPFPWLLALIPGAMLVFTLGLCIFLRNQPSVDIFKVLKEQASIDAALFQKASQ